jgi:hypothetical protein
MSDTNLDVSGTVALADEIIVLLVHMPLLDDLDLRVEEISQHSILYHLIQYAS